MTCNLQATGNLGITATVPLLAIARALTALPGASVYTGIPPLYYAFITHNSIGINSSAAIAISRAITSAGLINRGYPFYDTISAGSIGISGSVTTGVRRAAYAGGSVGVNGFLILVSVVRALNAAGSMGITATVRPRFNRGLATAGSIGVSSISRISRLRLIKVLDSIGISSNTTLKFAFVRIQAGGSIGINSVSNPAVRRALRAVGSIGITGEFFILVTPSVAGLNVIYLMEATDSGDPATLGAVLPRDYQRINLDKTISSYPLPYTLLN